MTMKIGDGFTSPNLVETAQEQYRRKQYEDVEMFPEPIPHTQVCQKCGRERILANFPRSKLSRTGHMRTCRDCFSATIRKNKPWEKAAEKRQERTAKERGMTVEKAKEWKGRGKVRGHIEEAFRAEPHRVFTTAEVRALFPDTVPYGTISSSLSHLKKSETITHLGPQRWTLNTTRAGSPSETVLWRKASTEEGMEVTRTLTEEDGVLWLTTVKVARTRVE